MRNLFLVASAALLVACANHGNPLAQSKATAGPHGTTKARWASPEQPLAAESNPPGDIPDTQAFVSFVPPSGPYQIDVPEGWARTGRSNALIFTDKFDGE